MMLRLFSPFGVRILEHGHVPGGPMAVDASFPQGQRGPGVMDTGFGDRAPWLDSQLCQRRGQYQYLP